MFGAFTNNNTSNDYFDEDEQENLAHLFLSTTGPPQKPDKNENGRAGEKG